MSRFGILTAAAILTASTVPAFAHEEEPLLESPLPFRMEEALDRMMEELKPAMRDLMDIVKSFEGIDDPRYYTMPEILPNGDIIIRRRDDAPAYRDPSDPTERDWEPPIMPPRDPRDETKT